MKKDKGSMKKNALIFWLLCSFGFDIFAQTPTPTPTRTATPTPTPTRTPTPIPTPTGFPAWIVSGEKVTADIVNRPTKQIFAS